MSRLYLRAQVSYTPGPWGARAPVPGARVDIVDVDLPGIGDDTIWSGTTGGDGRFEGWSSEWKDSGSVPVIRRDEWGRPYWDSETIEDPTDVLALVAHITDGGHDAWLPFAWVGGDQQSPDIIVPWGPESFVPPPPPGGRVFDPPSGVMLLATVNGHGCLLPTDVSARVHAEIEGKVEEIRIDVFEPIAVGLLAFTAVAAPVADWAGGQLGIPERWLPGRNEWLDADAAGMAVGCAIVKIAAAPSPFLTAVGVAVLYAVNKGYVNVSVGAGGKRRGAMRPGVRITVVR